MNSVAVEDIIISKLERMEDKLDLLQNMISTNQVQISNLEAKVDSLNRWRERTKNRNLSALSWIVTNVIVLIIYLLEKLLF
jgi:hypothetical protein